MNRYTYTNSHANSRSKKNTRRSGLETRKLLLFYILPFIIVNGIIFYLATCKPKFTVTAGETTDYSTTSMTFTIKSILPTKNLSITINSEPLELEQTGKKTYTATVTQNGTIEIYLENFNGMAVTAYEHVNILDDEPPQIDTYSIVDGVLTVTLSDSQSGIDFSSIYAVTSTGATVHPLSVDKQTSTVTFTSDPNGLTLYLKDMSGHITEQPFSITESVVDKNGNVVES